MKCEFIRGTIVIFAENQAENFALDHFQDLKPVVIAEQSLKSHTKYLASGYPELQHLLVYPTHSNNFPSRIVLAPKVDDIGV